MSLHKDIELGVKKILLRLLVLFKGEEKEENTIKLDSGSKVLLIRLNRIGDALISTPFIALLKENFNCSIDILADRKNSFVFKNNPKIDRVFVFRKGISNFIRIIRDINRANYNVIADLHDDVSATVTYLIAFSKSDFKVGLKKETSDLYSKTAERLPAETTHVVDRVNNILTIFGPEVEKSDENIEYFPSDIAFKKASSFIESKYQDKKPLVGINISAGSEARFWGVDKFRELIDHLKGKYNLDLLILTAPGDKEKAAKIAGTEFPLFYSESFEEFAALISKLNLLITPDTSIIHIASSFQIPVFGLYVKYRTSDMIWSPYKSRFEAVITEEPNLHNIGFTEVKNKLDQFIENTLSDDIYL